MEQTPYRTRPLAPGDVETVLQLMQMANEEYTPKNLDVHRNLLELTAAPDDALSDAAMREMASQLAAMSGHDEQVVYARMRELQESGSGAMAQAMVTRVAVEEGSGEVVGVVNAGPPGKWAHAGLTQLPPDLLEQMRERIVEISDIAAAVSAPSC